MFFIHAQDLISGIHCLDADLSPAELIECSLNQLHKL